MLINWLVHSLVSLWLKSRWSMFRLVGFVGEAQVRSLQVVSLDVAAGKRRLAASGQRKDLLQEKVSWYLAASAVLGPGS